MNNPGTPLLHSFQLKYQIQRNLIMSISHTEGWKTVTRCLAKPTNPVTKPKRMADGR